MLLCENSKFKKRVSEIDTLMLALLQATGDHESNVHWNRTSLNFACFKVES